MRHGTKTPYRDEFKIDKRDTDSRINRLQEGLASLVVFRTLVTRDG